MTDRTPTTAAGRALPKLIRENWLSLDATDIVLLNTWVRAIEAEARASLDVAARAFAEHVSAIACDHAGSGAGTHTGCPERLALDAALEEPTP